MSDAAGKTVQNLGYHAHIYYDPEKTRPVAERVCAAIDEKLIEASKKAAKRGVTLLLENEPSCNTATGAEAASSIHFNESS